MPESAAAGISFEWKESAFQGRSKLEARVSGDGRLSDSLRKRERKRKKEIAKDGEMERWTREFKEINRRSSGRTERETPRRQKQVKVTRWRIRIENRIQRKMF